MQGSQPFLPVAPSQFEQNAQGFYIVAAPGDVEPYTLGWDDAIQYPAETITSVKWNLPIGVADAPNSALYCAPLAVGAQLITNWTPITAGSFALAVDGGSVTNITGLSFAGLTTLPQVAAAIQTAVRAALTDLTTVTFDAVNDRFVITSPTVGPTGNISFLTPVGSGTDISAMLGGALAVGAVGSSLPGPYQAPGVPAKSAVAALSTDWLYSPFIGVFLISATMTSSVGRIKTKTFQLQVAENV